MTRWFIALFLLSSSAIPALAADLGFLPPIESVNRILDEHPIVGTAEANKDAAQSEAARLRAGPHEVLLSGYLGNRTVNNQGNFSVWDFTVSRGFRRAGKAEQDALTGTLGVEYGMNAIEDAKHQTALLLLDGWMAWLEAEALAAIDDAETQSYARERDAIAQRVLRQDAAQRDADLAAAAFSRASAAALASHGMAAEARAGLQRIFPEMSVALAAPEIAAPELPELPLNRWFDLILRRSHEVRMAELEAARQQSLAARAELERKPDPSLGLRAYSENSGVETGLVLVFSIPIGGAGRSAAAEAQSAKARAAVADLARIKREFELRAQQDVVKTEAGLSTWRQSASARDATSTALTRTRRGYELGEFDLSELLLISRQYYDAQRAELASRAAAQRATLQLQIDGHELWVLHDENE